ncbi:MAG: TraC family protein [Desulfosalsimonadaceae bacterium]
MLKPNARKLMANLMPYVAHDTEMEMYLNTDETVGFAWKCQPLVASETAPNKQLQPVFDFNMPEGSVLQFMLCADPDYSLVVSVKFDVDEKIEVQEALDIRDLISNELKKMQLNPQPQTPQDFIDFTRKIFTGNNEKKIYNDEKPIKRQCIPDETKIELNWNEIKFNARVLNCLTLRLIPEEVEIASVQELLEGFFKFSNTPEKYSASCLYALNIVFDKKSAKPESEISKRIKKFAPGFTFPAKTENKANLTILPSFWLISKSASEAASNLKDLKKTIERCGFEAHEEKEILTPLFVASIPFGVYTAQNSFKSMNRGFVLTWEDAVKFLPLQVTKRWK